MTVRKQEPGRQTSKMAEGGGGDQGIGWHLLCFFIGVSCDSFPKCFVGVEDLPDQRFAQEFLVPSISDCRKKTKQKTSLPELMLAQQNR